METQPIKRKLTTIFSTDVQGYSRLMVDDEAATIRTLTAYKEVISAHIEKHGGRVIDSPGDNLLAEFGSVVHAVESAGEIQRALKERNEELPDGRKMEFRIGINVGDVVVEGERLYGDGVNIAARLESLAEGGGVCISGDAYRQVQDRLPFGFEDLGEHSVKNFPRPVHAYRVLMEPGATGTEPASIPARRDQRRWAAWAAVAVVVLGGAAVWNFYLRPPSIEPASVEKMKFPLPEKPSIAVLPFTNLSGDKKQDYLGEGIAENIITALSQLPDMFVIARNSTFTYKGKAVKVQKVAEDLGVRYILEGSVQRAGEKVRITAQLIDAIKGNHLWAKRYDRELKDVFALQDDIAWNVVTAMEVKLTEGDMARIRRAQTNSPEAYRYYKRAAPLLKSFTKDTNAQARQLAEKAVSLDPNFSSGWVRLGFIDYLAAKFGWSGGPVRGPATQAEQLARKALAIDPSNPDVYMLLSTISLYRRDSDKAIAYGEKAVALGPSHAGAAALLGRALLQSGRPKEALPLIQRGIRLRPFPPANWLRFVGEAHRSMGRYEEAIAAFESARSRKPKSPLPIIWLAMTYADAGRMEEARAMVQEILKRNPKFSAKRHVKTLDYKDPAERERALASLRKAGLPDVEPVSVKKMKFALPEKPSIAVLPFTNISGDKEQEYFSDGITEDIITDLSKVSGLFVIARNSSFKYKGKSVDVRNVARDLGVRYALEGSVRRSGEQLRITVQLVDATTGGHVWAERYDRGTKDVFAIQDEIAAKVASELAVTLKADEQERLFRRHTNNLEAYETFLRAQRLGGGGANRRAKRKRLYERVIELDPQFAGGYAGLAIFYRMRVRRGQSASPEKDIERALSLAKKAIAIDDTYAGSYLALAHSYRDKHEHDKAVAAAQEAVRLQPSYANGYAFLGLHLHSAGRAEEAIDAFKTAARLNPKPARFRSLRNLRFLGMAYFIAGRYQDAIAALNRNYANSLRRGSTSPGYLAAAYAATGQDEKARAVMKAFLEKKPGLTISNWRSPQNYKRKEDRDRFVNLLRKAGMPE